MTAHGDAWASYRKRRNLALFAFIGYVPVVFVVASCRCACFRHLPPLSFWRSRGWCSSSSLETWPCGSLVRDAESGSSRNGGITTILHGGAFTVVCRSMLTPRQKRVNEWPVYNSDAGTVVFAVVSV